MAKTKPTAKPARSGPTTGRAAKGPAAAKLGKAAPKAGKTPAPKAKANVTPKSATATKATEAPAKKATKAAAAKKTSKAPAAKKTSKAPVPKTPAARTPETKPRKVSARRRGPAPIDSLSSAEILARIVLFARSDEDLGDEVPRLVERLQQTADPTLIPAMFGALDDDDPHGVLWSVFYMLESFDDDYLAGLLEALPELAQRAPTWADTAVLRIVNTRGEPEDCTGTFVALAKRAKATSRKRTATMLARMGKSLDGLHTAQRKVLAEMAKAIGGT
jgi:hypothetical protein